jgi:hypothetical protein
VNLETTVLRVLVFGSIALYWVLQRRERSKVRDERSALIHLKAVELVHNCIWLSLAPFTLAYLWNPDLDAIYVLAGGFVLTAAGYPLARMRLSRVL